MHVSGRQIKQVVYLKGNVMKKQFVNWDDYSGQKIIIPQFIYGRDDLPVGVFEGIVRGYGALPFGKMYHDRIGVYTDEGFYFNIQIDTRTECAVPQFFIDRKSFRYPIVCFFKMCGGLPAIDPTTGNLRTRQEMSAKYLLEESLDDCE